MESKNRNWWIIIVAAVLVMLCCCTLAGAAAVTGGLFAAPFDRDGVTSPGRERIEQTFEVGASPSLTIDNFAGSVTVRAGESGEIHVIATKQAPGARNLDRIKVEMSGRDGGLAIKTTKPSGLGNASVQLEITAPAGTYLDLHTGAGNVEVSGLSGGAKVHTGAGNVTARDLSGDVKLDSGAGSVEVHDVAGSLEVDTGAGSVEIDGLAGDIEAHSGAGSIEVRGASGLVRLDTGSGSIDYQGTPQGDCRFETGTGSITLRLPAGLDADVDLHTGVGTIEVEFDVEGQISKRDVKGVVGAADGAKIYAHTGSGSIDLLRH